MNLERAREITVRIGIAAAVSGVLLAVVLTFLINDRPDMDTVEFLPVDDMAEPMPGVVTMTWLGVGTLLFDDGDTQILVDGFVSRPSLADIVFRRPVSNDIPLINQVLLDYEMERIAAIIPAHSHFDHAMDIGAIANRSSASVMGSESTANIARGSGVPEDQVLVAEAGIEYAFGEFRVTLLDSPHAPIGWRGATPLAGTIDEPLELPASIAEWREGGSFSIVVGHPQGTALVHGSAGYAEQELQELHADVVVMSVAQLKSLGRNYAERYWQALVTSTGAFRVLPIHFDDLTAPFGEIRLPPRIVDNFPETARWLREFRQTWDQDVSIVMPEFGEPIAIYSVAPAPSS